MTRSVCNSEPLVLVWVTVAGTLSNDLCSVLALAVDDIVGRVRAQSGAHTDGPVPAGRATPFVLMDLDRRLACDPGILRQVRGLLPCESILIYVSQGPRPPHPCWLAVAARVGFAAGTMAQVTAGTGVLHLACRDPGDTDRLLRRRHLSVLPGRPGHTPDHAERAR